MFVDIKAIQFNLLRHTQSYCLINHFEDDEHHHQHIGSHTDCAQYLNSQLSESTAVKQADTYTVSAIAEQANCQSSPDSIYHVDRNRTYRIIYLCYIIKELHSQNYQNTGDQADEECSNRSHTVTGSRNSYQPRKSCIKRNRHIRFSITDPCKNHTHDCGNRRCKVCIEHYQRCQFHIRICRHCNCGSSVKSKPAEPEDKHTERHRHDIMPGNRSCFSVFIVFSDTRPKHCRAKACDQSSNHMYTSGTCKIMKAK